MSKRYYVGYARVSTGEQKMDLQLEEKEVAFKSLTENIDTGTSGGKLQFHIFSALGYQTPAAFAADQTTNRINPKPAPALT